MTIDELIQQMQQRYDGFNPPASEEELKRLQDAGGVLPDAVLHVYRDHNGSRALPRRGGGMLPARLLPVEEAIKTNQNRILAAQISTGTTRWLWYDDNSNYVGFVADGPLRGFLVKLYHEEPILTPAYRSVQGFLNRLLQTAPRCREDFDKEDTTLDIIMVPTELPAAHHEPEHLSADRSLAASLKELFKHEPDPDRRRLFAQCTISLTPFADTASLVEFFGSRICGSRRTL